MSKEERNLGPKGASSGRKGEDKQGTKGVPGTVPFLGRRRTWADGGQAYLGKVKP